MPKIRKKCKCGKIFYVRPYRIHTAKYCSIKCRAKFQVLPQRQKGYKGPNGSLAKMVD